MSSAGRKIKLIVPDRGIDRIRGGYPAKVTLVLYGEYPSLESARVYQGLRELQQQFGEQLCWAFRYFLKKIEPESCSHHAAEAAEAAASQGKFWEMSDYLMERCLNEPQHHFDDACLVEAAIAIDLNVNRFLQEISEDVHVPRIGERVNSGIQCGVCGAPTLFINGWRYDGSLSRDALFTLISSLISSSEFSCQ